MAQVRKAHIKLLRPYLVGEEPRENGEWDMRCPLHEDHKRSAQINVQKGVWYCQAGCGGGRVGSLIRRQGEWFDPPATSMNGGRKTKAASTPKVELTEAMVKGWTVALWSSEKALEKLMEARGLDEETIERFEIGWNPDLRAYTIPVRAPDGTLWNVRHYDMSAPEDRRKIWSYAEGYGAPRLYPIQILDEDPKSIVVCEGEWDALLTIQNGYAAITRTGAADVWKPEWSGEFRDRVVYLCHDADEKGQAGNRRVGRALKRIAKDVRVIKLPYKVVKKHGKDLTDFWLEHNRKDFRKLLKEAQPLDPPEEVEHIDPKETSVMDALDSKRVGHPVSMIVTIQGKREPGYSIPERSRFMCTQDAGSKCNVCPMNAVEGDTKVSIPADDPTMLELLDAPKQRVHEVLREFYGAEKCNKLEISPESYHSVEILYARPSIDHVQVDPGKDGAGDYKQIKVTNVGKHDTNPNNTVEVVGALYPSPRSQANEFLSWDLNRLETSLDNFDLDAKTVRLLKRFRPAKGETPLQKLGDIALSLQDHVTHIYGRPQMHAAMDLVFHSVLSFDFGGKRIRRGWLELLVVGDTRTGKSEVAQRLTRHYQGGEVVNCESATFAGIVGGAQQFGGGKEWHITWGAIPMNDRRLVVLDEVGGMSHESIAKMSDVRSRGVAQLTMIQTDATPARTRLIWTGNPRNGRMSDYTYGVQAIQPLIGNPEDVARFDLAMSVRTDDVASNVINRAHATGTLRYTMEASSALLRWAWSRRPDQIVWAEGAEEAVYREAQRMGERYIEEPPLVQVANVREKIARVAAALAARLFSTDRTYENVVVRRIHVRDAVKFLDKLYGMKSFGYAERSRMRIADASEADEKRGEIKLYMYANPGLAKFLRDTSKFRRQDVEEVLNMDRDQAIAVINKLLEARMVRKDKGDVRIEPTLQELLREINIR